MDGTKLLNYIENSFLSPILSIDDLTDISYNGSKLFYMTNSYGRTVCDIPFEKKEIKDFIRQIANLSEKLFSFSNPILDVAVSQYRINAVHDSIARYIDEETITFSIRIIKDTLLAKDNPYMNISPLIELFKVLLINKISIVIGGETGSGKSELQKLIISLLEVNNRVIIIDNCLELNNAQKHFPLDTTIWLSSDLVNRLSTSKLINVALRNNPDWLIVAEAKQNEIYDIVNSVSTGHPLITTIHSFDALNINEKMASLLIAQNKNITFENALEFINHHFQIFIHVKTIFIESSGVIRYIDSIVLNENGEKIEIFSNNLKQLKYSKIPSNFLKKLTNYKQFKDFYKYFVKEDKNEK